MNEDYRVTDAETPERNVPKMTGCYRRACALASNTDVVSSISSRPSSCRVCAYSYSESGKCAEVPISRQSKVARASAKRGFQTLSHTSSPEIRLQRALKELHLTLSDWTAGSS